MSAADVGTAYLGWRQAARAMGHALLMHGAQSTEYRTAKEAAEVARAEWDRVMVAVEGDA